MSDIKMSVIIPCYNGWRYMDRCLKSLENQTLSPYETVIVDDCSTDDSYNCLKAYAENSRLNINLIRNEKNCGPGVSRKKAIAAARGDYIIFCDCDDWYEDKYVELMAEKIRLESADVVVCDNYSTYDDRKVVCGAVKNLIGADKKTIIALSYSSLCRLAVKKSLFDGVSMPAIYNGEDAAIIPQILAKANKVSIVDVPLYNYYFREDSASKKPSKKVYLGLLEAFQAVESIRPQFKEECEFIGVKLVCYGATLNAFKGGLPTKTISEFVTKFNKKYPGWINNPYIGSYDKFKRLYVKLISKKLFLPCRIMALMHHYITKHKK